MKTGMIGIGLLVAVLFTGQLAGAQQGLPEPQGPNPRQAMDIRSKHLDLEQREAEMEFGAQMRNIQLERKRFELEHDRQMLKAEEQKPVPGKDGWREHPYKKMHICGLLLVCLVVHILLAIWVYQDIRRRNAGSGIWIVVTLLTGLLGALVYAVARLGDKPA